MTILNKQITGIKISNESKFLEKFEWDDIPKFAVITGINGSGKTGLLECINVCKLGGLNPSPSGEDFSII